MRRNLKHNFLRFSLGAKDQPLIGCIGSGWVWGFARSDTPAGQLAGA